MSIATRIGATNDEAQSSIMSRCSGQSTITTGASSGWAAVSRARRVIAAVSALG